MDNEKILGFLKKKVWAWWLITAVIQTIWEADIRKVVVQGQPRQKLRKTPSNQ
jgi:hypothetical protein